MGKVIDDPLDTFGHDRGTKVQEQAQGESGQPEVGQDLTAVHPIDLFNGFHFDQQCVLNDHVDLVRSRYHELVVDEVHPDGCFEGNATVGQFVSEAGRVRGFKAAGSEPPMNGNTGGNDVTFQLILFRCAAHVSMNA